MALKSGFGRPVFGPNPKAAAAASENAASGAIVMSLTGASATDLA
jgi:hypothetical protein